jgi:hypothetical protein
MRTSNVVNIYTYIYIYKHYAALVRALVCGTYTHSSTRCVRVCVPRGEGRKRKERDRGEEREEGRVGGWVGGCGEAERESRTRGSACDAGVREGGRKRERNSMLSRERERTSERERESERAAS